MEILYQIQSMVWGLPLMALLLGTGAYLMYFTRGLPVRKLGWAVKETLHSYQEDKEDDVDENGRGGEISAFSSLCTELAATIGIGNIVGVVSAVMLGGPGALWWMFLSSVLGLATKLAESTLSVKYRKKDVDGNYIGGPMVTLVNDAFPFKRLGRFLSICYSILAIFCSLGMGNMVQANSIASSLNISFQIPLKTTGFFLMLLILFVMLGGAKMISKVASYLVPAMGLLYLLGCFGILATHATNIIPALTGSLRAAIDPQAVCGGLFGTIHASVFSSMKWGISRGIFSNEAGLGAAGISAAASGEKDPVRQGYVSMTGVFFDTMIICMITGITFCAGGIMGEISDQRFIMKNGDVISANDGAGLMLATFENTYGRYGMLLLTVCIVLFAFATILGWGYQGERVFSFLFGGKAVGIYRFVYGICSFLGAFMALEFIWTFSDICNGLLALPNLICVLILSGGICREICTWRNMGEKAGEERGS